MKKILIILLIFSSFFTATAQDINNLLQQTENSLNEQDIFIVGNIGINIYF